MFCVRAFCFFVSVVLFWFSSRIFYLNDFLNWIWFLFHNGFYMIVVMVVMMMLDFDPLFGFKVVWFANVVIIVMRFRSVHINHFLDFWTFGSSVFLIFWINIANVFVRFRDSVTWTMITALRVSWFHRIHMNLTHFAMSFFNDVNAGLPSRCGLSFIGTGNIVTFGLGRIKSNGRCYCNRCKYHQTKSLYEPKENTKLFAIIQNFERPLKW